MLQEFIGRLSSRKFLLSVAAIGIIVLDGYLNIGLTPQDKTLLITVVIGFIGAEGAKDLMTTNKKK
jgi:hypothetical protein